MPEESQSEKDFPNWDNLYKSQNVETMPWYNKNLDSDLEEELEKRKITKGRAREVCIHDKDKETSFIVDDILNSEIIDKSFNYVFDRGCFHVLPIEMRLVYIKEIKRILDENGIWFLKCFSTKEPRQEGPYKFSDDEIRQLFRNDFVIISVKDTVYKGTLDPLPKALFVVMNRR